MFPPMVYMAFGYVCSCYSCIVIHYWQDEDSVIGSAFRVIACICYDVCIQE